MDKPIRHAVSIILKNEHGQTLFALRSAHKESYPNTWSLPSHFVNEGESYPDTIRRIGRHKLGVELEPGELFNEGRADRGAFILFMHDYAARIVEGTPTLHSDDYSALAWEDAEVQFSRMDEMGECCRLYKEGLQKTFPDNK